MRDKYTNSNIINSGDNNTNNITDNRYMPIYKTTIINNIINAVPNDIDNFRAMLSSIEMYTCTKYHIFTGFVNYGDENRIVICNVFWNSNIYICNHIITRNNIPVRDGVYVEGGYFIVFRGRIKSYDRRAGSEDKGIEVLEIIDAVPYPSVYCYHVKDTGIKQYTITEYISTDMIQRYYNIQMNRIHTKLETSKYFVPEMYEAILHSVLYEYTREQKMIKNQLKLEPYEYDYELIKTVSLLRYLVCDTDMMQSPFLVFKTMNQMLKPEPGKERNKIYNKTVRQFSEYPPFMMDGKMKKRYEKNVQ